MPQLCAPTCGLLVAGFNLSVKPVIYLSRIGRGPTIFAGEFAHLLPVGVIVAAIDREIDVMLFHILVCVKDADTIQTNFRLAVETLVLEGVTHLLLHLRGGEFDAVLVHEFIPPKHDAVVDVIFLMNEPRLDHSAHCE